MGLDMFLLKVKKHPHLSPATLLNIGWELYTFEDLLNDPDETTRHLYNALIPYTYKYAKYEHSEEKTYLYKQIAYWRKANAIHKWFVENVQHGFDDCRSAVVSKEQIEELLETCKKITPQNASTLLPTQPGFFFGSTDYDEYYYEDIQYTIVTLEKILKETDWDNEYVLYKSSW